MDHILKDEIVGILNAIQRGEAPKLESNELMPSSTETSAKATVRHTKPAL